MKKINVPKNWVRADYVRVRKVNGKRVVEIKRNPARTSRGIRKAKKRKALNRRFVSAGGRFKSHHLQGNPTSAAYSSPLYKKASLKDRMALRLRTAKRKLTGTYKRNPTRRKPARRKSTKKRGKR